MMRFFKILTVSGLFYLGLFSQVFAQESRKISGVVSDVSEPLANVTISVSGGGGEKNLGEGNDFN